MNGAESTRAGRGADQLARMATGIVLLAGTAFVIAHDWLGVGGQRFDFLAGGPLYDAVVVAAAVACLLRARAVPRERGAWLLIALAVACWAAGEIYWTAFILDDPSAPYPSPADIGYLGFYPIAAAGLVLLIRARAHDLDWRLWADSLIAAMATAALGTAFVFEFVADRTTGTDLQVATSLAYPLGDIAMLAAIVGAVALTGWRPDRTWSLLVAGLATMAIADIAYTLQSTGGVLPAGNWVDPIYLISAALVGAVLWQPSASRLDATVGGGIWRELIVPGLVATVMIGLFLMHYLDATSVLSTALWAATMFAVVIRLAVSVRENERLLEQVQTDVLTGLANRGRMQIDLERLCAHADEERPIAVVFLDLDGFKRYNDTLGHPAGDLLLTGLGRALSDAVAGEGTAYRVGGDEFCLLLTCPAESFDSAASRAGRALSASGPGFEVTASWGVARIPSEAPTPHEALRLADVRMYAQKESHHLARRGHDEPPLPAPPPRQRVS